MDRLSSALLVATPGVRVAVAATAEEREAILGLRRRQVMAWTGADPAEQEPDSYDGDAIHIGAWDGPALVGTVRLVLPAPDRRLPAEEAFDLWIEPRGAVVEAGRLVVAPDFRGDPAHRVWGALLARAWVDLRARGYAVLGGAASPAMVARLCALGLPFEILGPARPHWGEERHPVRLDPASGSPTWY